MHFRLCNVTCAESRTLLSEDLRGQVLRLTTDSETEPAVIATDLGTKFATINLPAAGGTGTGCVAQQDMREDFATLLGTTPDILAGIQILVDPNGWLPARWTTGESRRWPTPERLSSRIRMLAEPPLPQGAAKVHHH